MRFDGANVSLLCMVYDKREKKLLVDGVVRELLYGSVFVVISICYTILVSVNICRYETLLVFICWLKLSAF